MPGPGISEDAVRSFKEKLETTPQFRVAQNACTKHNPLEILRRRVAEEELSHVFSHKIEAEGKPVTNQHSSGRCWIFACLNCMRLPLMKSLNVEDLELSQNYLFFWDKIERMNYMLHAYVEIARRGETADGRLVNYLVHNPTEDGGQWNMLVNLIEKYGVMPKKCFPDTWSCENSRFLGKFLNYKARESCMKLHALVKKGSSEEDVQAAILGMMDEIYRIVAICLGTAPQTFTWEYYDKDKKYHKIGPISPLDFYKEYVKPHYNIADKVMIVNDPREKNPYNALYTVEFLNNMVGGQEALYINQHPDVLKKAAAESLKNNEAVWFGCDVEKRCSWKKHGFQNLDAFDYDLVFGVSTNTMSKAERLIFGESLMTHAMVLSAVTEEDGKTTKWRIENSWGEDGGEKGYMAMTDNWFTEYVYEVVVDKKFIPEEVLTVLQQKPTMLPAWDPMGSLA